MAQTTEHRLTALEGETKAQREKLNTVSRDANGIRDELAGLRAEIHALALEITRLAGPVLWWQKILTGTLIVGIGTAILSFLNMNCI